ncbi:hypothetical protein SK128_019678, partial [Halocaridina rubra]
MEACAQKTLFHHRLHTSNGDQPGGNTWTSVTGRVVTLENTTLLQLTELERLTLQQLAIAKLQALNLGCQIRMPRDGVPEAKQRGSLGSHEPVKL